jgi:hypothetical protein
MTTSSITALKFLTLIGCLLLAALPLNSAARPLTEEQIDEIEFHYNLDKYMVGGCILGAAFGTATGVMALSGITVVAAVPYIATGCSMGFLIGASGLILYDFFRSHPDISLEDRRANAY